MGAQPQANSTTKPQAQPQEAVLGDGKETQSEPAAAAMEGDGEYVEAVVGKASEFGDNE